MLGNPLFLLLPLILQQQSAPLDDIANQVIQQINEETKTPTSIYDKILLKQVPEEKLRDIYKSFRTKHGRVVSVTPKRREKKESGGFTLAFENGVEMPMTLTITRRTPPKITGIWFGAAVATFEDIDAIIKQIKKLPGKVNFQISRLGDKNEAIYSLNPDESLAIGSTFKIYLLGTIVAQNHAWTDVVALKEEHKSLPSGILQTWPNGSPLTVHTLASQMISISDNTATDHLLYYLGRKNVESQLAAMGNQTPTQSWPMLTTLEMFKIKSHAKLLRKYARSDIAARRSTLETEVEAISRDGLAPFADGTPLAIDKVEWFASAADLCRAMDWFRTNADKKARDILAINSGISVLANEFDYVGYKGGSEPGVINFTWLLRTKKGDHYAFSMGWNNPDEDGIDLEVYLGFAQATLRLIAAR